MRRLLSPASNVVAIGVVALLELLAYGVRSTAPDPGIEQALASGDRPRAPDVQLPRFDGRGSASLADYRRQVEVLNYWASWCAPRRADSPLLERWHRRLGPRGGGVDVLDRSRRIAAPRRGPVDEEFMRREVVPLLEERA